MSSGNPIGTFSILRTDNLSNYGNRSVPELDGIVNKPLGAMDSGRDGFWERFIRAVEAQKTTYAHIPWLPW